jgi:alkaline phosphatase
LFVATFATATCRKPTARAAEPTPSAPKNIILLISDGCGFNHVDAASLYEHGKTGVQVYERFPFRAAMSTYCMKPNGSGGLESSGYDAAIAWSDPKYVLKGYTDSAASATTMSTGQKTYDGAIGVDIRRKPLVHAWQLAELRGKATGIVTSVQWSHATPAGFVAHNVSRSNYAEIAREIIAESATDVVMGCGHPAFDADGVAVKKPKTFKYVGGEAVWNALVDGTAGADADGDGQNDPWHLVQTRDEFRALMTGPTPKRVCGVAQVHKTLQQERRGDVNVPFASPLIESVPTLAELTLAALNVLDDDPDGFCLMVESGAVDWASHDNQLGRMVEAQIAMNRMVEAVVEWVEQHSGWDDTLVIVTGDHETGHLTSAPSGVQSLSSLGSIPDVSLPLKSNGPGTLPAMQWNSGNHTNSLIPIYAKGAGTHLLGPLARKTDPRRGAYLDNADVGRVVNALLTP